MFKKSSVLLLSVLLHCRRAESLVEEDSQCGKIFLEKTIIITSENYPSPYPKSAPCVYLLKGRNNCTDNVFVIEFLDFDVLESKGCVTDRLEIGHQDALCGIKKGLKRYEGEKGLLKVKFVAENAARSHRGFRLLVTRVDRCGAEEHVKHDFGYVTDNIEATTATNHHQPTKPPLSYLPPPTIQPCCQRNTYSDKLFHLVSPSFPYSTTNPTDCSFVIEKSGPSVCRLRINVLYFNLGPIEDSWLEIDGKRIWGCKSDLKLTAEFRDGNLKLVRFVSKGLKVPETSGFVLEFMQDECQKVVANDLQKRRPRRQADIQQLKLLNEKSFFIASDESNLANRDVYKHFYFFGPEDEQEVAWSRDNNKEEIDSVDLSSIENHQLNYQECLNWNFNQLSVLQRSFGNSLYSTCEVFRSTLESRECFILNSLAGKIISPGYPFGYPVNRNLCYRFKFTMGFCQIEIYFENFELETSFDCSKDYLLIDGDRYCGSYLSNKKVLISPKGRQNYEDIGFITDGNYCARGFSAVYQQVRCHGEENSIIRPDRCFPRGKPNPECRRIVSEEKFVISSRELGRVCRWEVKKYSMDVCKIEFYLQRFRLPCPSGRLEINGITLCGDRTGQSLSLDAVGSLTIIYRGEPLHGDPFLIEGRQITDCGHSIPDPVRFMVTESYAGT